MKFVFLVVTITLFAVPAFAQGKINAENCSVITQGNNNKTTVNCGGVTCPGSAPMRQIRLNG